MSDGHRGFSVESCPNMDFKTAASRRDFTMNAMGYDVEKHCILDPYNGQSDIKSKQLRHVSNAFGEDPLRVYRAMQFAARFDFNVMPETIALCRDINVGELAKERVFEEVKKLLLLAQKPSKGFDFLRKCGISDHFKELFDCINIPQDNRWHMEGDVWIHTLMVIDEMAKRRPKEQSRALRLMLAAVCHDLGKVKATRLKDGVWVAYGHDVVGVDSADTLLRRMTDENALIESVKILVREHMQPLLLYLSSLNNPVKNATIRKLALRIPLPDLLLLANADHYGRIIADESARENLQIQWLTERAKMLGVLEQPPSALLQGRDLVDLGIQEGPKMGKLLRMPLRRN